MAFFLELDDTLRVSLREYNQVLDAQSVNIVVINGIANQNMMELLEKRLCRELPWVIAVHKYF